MSRPLTVGGLFSGIGGWELGLERAGMEIAWHCEADPFCQRVLEKHWPGVPIFEDVCTLTAGMAEGVDVLCGGFPCQDISLAGRGGGIDGARSGLWAEFARLIGEFRPRYVLVENVSALLGRDIDRVLGDLAALGFDAEWDCIPASAVGAPHRRDRVWIVAYPKRGGSSNSGEPVADSTRDAKTGICASPRTERERAPKSDDEQRQRCGDAVDDCCADVADPHEFGELEPHDEAGAIAWSESREGSGRRSERGRSRSWPSAWAIEPDVGRVAHGVPARVDRLRALGNALVPQIAEWIGRRIVAYELEMER